MQCFQPVFSRIVNDSISRKEAERKEPKREVLTFFLWGNFYRRSYWRSTRWYLWRPALLVAEARQLLFLALSLVACLQKGTDTLGFGHDFRHSPMLLQSLCLRIWCWSDVCCFGHKTWGLEACTEASSMYTWASLQMRWDWFMVFCCNFHDIKDLSHVGMAEFKAKSAVSMIFRPSGWRRTSSGFQDVRSLFRPEMFLKQDMWKLPWLSSPNVRSPSLYTKGILLLENWQSIFHLECRNMKWIHIIYCNPLTEVYTVVLIFYKHH